MSEEAREPRSRQFTHKGRKRRLFERRYGGSWYLRLTFEGKRREKTLGTSSYTLAVERAKRVIDDMDAGTFGDEPEGESCDLTVEALCDRYKSHARNVRDTTAAKNVGSLYRVLRAGTGLDRVTLDTKPVSEVLTEETILGYIAAQQERVKPDLRTIRADGHSICAAIRQARSVVGRRALDDSWPAETAETIFAATKGFRTAPTPKTSKAQVRFRPIPAATLAKMAAAINCEKDSNPELWKCHWLIRSMALRASEVYSAKADWLIERTTTDLEGNQQKALFIEITSRPEDGYEPKSVNSDRVVRVPDFLIEPLLASSDYLIDAPNEARRYDIVYREHSEFLRPFLPKRGKTGHELRKQVVSEMLEKTGGNIYLVSEWAGDHPDTLRSHYAAQLRDPVFSADDLKL